jgi:hypothetical protein
MRLFLYGTLLDPGTLAMRGGQADLASRTGYATLPGWQRVRCAVAAIRPCAAIAPGR